ncbi:MAG: hypothetical protein MGU50_22330 [Trichodesmium sp. MAG_R02]|nr:hypothetical protein [Trichodesmium sp. MAG_R02]
MHRTYARTPYIAYGKSSDRYNLFFSDRQPFVFWTISSFKFDHKSS